MPCRPSGPEHCRAGSARHGVHARADPGDRPVATPAVAPDPIRPWRTMLRSRAKSRSLPPRRASVRPPVRCLRDAAGVPGGTGTGPAACPRIAPERGGSAPTISLANPRPSAKRPANTHILPPRDALATCVPRQAEVRRRDVAGSGRARRGPHRCGRAGVADRPASTVSACVRQPSRCRMSSSNTAMSLLSMASR